MKTKDVFTASNPREYIQDLDEDALIENVIIPLYQKNKYLLIDRHSHGQGELGKDIIFKEADSFPKPVYHAIQAKVVKIGINNVGKIIDQAKAAFNVPFRDPYLNAETKVDFVEVITSGKVTDDSRKRFHAEIPDRRHIILIDGEQLIDLIIQAKNICKIDTSQTTALPSAKIPSNISPSTEFKIEEVKQLPSVEADLEKLDERIREGKLPNTVKKL